MRLLALILVFAACTRTQYVAAPTPPKPTPNHARAIAESFIASSDTKCALWTGRETPYAGVDAMVCVAPGQLLYIAAPEDGPPVVKVALQMESPPSPPPAEKKPDPPKTEPVKPTKPEPKKK